MATTETSAVMKFIDSNGDINIIYPITKDNVITTTGDGSAYVATVKGITSLTAGVSFTMIPHVVSTSTSPTINVNDLGAIRIRRRVTSVTATTSGGYDNDWLSAGKPVRLTYDGTFWIADLQKPSATDLMGAVPIANGGTGATTAEAARSNLGLGTAATEDTVSIQNGGTGATTAEAARSNLGLGTVATEDTVSIQNGGTGATTAAEALTALGAVAKAGDTMAGHLHIGTSGYPTVYFEDADGNGCGSVFASASNKRTYLRCYATDDSGYYENYRAPAASDGMTANKTYDILTTKTVTYGTKDPATAVGAAGIAGRIYFKKVSS